MKVISLWQPYAALAVHGYKKFETRPKAPPRTLAKGDRFAIAATKQVKSDQQIAADHPRLQRHYREIGMPAWKELPRGCIIGTVMLGDFIEITNKMVMDINEDEYVYGDWREGRWAWALLNPIVFKKPVPCSGQQGIWDYHGHLPEA